MKKRPVETGRSYFLSCTLEVGGRRRYRPDWMYLRKIRVIARSEATWDRRECLWCNLLYRRMYRPDLSAFFFPVGRKIIVLPPSSRRQATVHWTVAFRSSNLFGRQKKTHTGWCVSFLNLMVTFDAPSNDPWQSPVSTEVPARFVCIFLPGGKKNYCVAAVEPSASNSPLDCCI